MGAAEEHELFDVLLTAYVPALEASVALRVADDGSVDVLSVNLVPVSKRGCRPRMP